MWTLITTATNKLAKTLKCHQPSRSSQKPFGETHPIRKKKNSLGKCRQPYEILYSINLKCEI